MATAKVVAPNIRENARDNGEVISYSVRVSIDGKDVRLTLTSLEEAIIARDKLTSQQYAAQLQRRKQVDRLNFKHCGFA